MCLIHTLNGRRWTEGPRNVATESKGGSRGADKPRRKPWNGELNGGSQTGMKTNSWSFAPTLVSPG